MRFLFTTIPGSGHFHPLVPTARALQRRGHDVAFAASPTFAPAIEAAGFEAHPAGPAWVENLSDPVMQKIMAGEFFVDLIRMGMVEGIIRAAKATGADAIVRGSGELGGLVAGAILDLPVASASPAAAKFYEPMIRPARRSGRRRAWPRWRAVTAVDYEILRIDRTPPSLEMPGYVAPPNAINVRPEPFDAGGELPAWFDDLGRASARLRDAGDRHERQHPAVQADRGCPRRTSRSTWSSPSGHGIPREALGEVAGNIRVGGFLPQARILERASAVVNHGGYGTVSAALGAGLPLFLLPMGADQPYNTERCITAGAALGVIQDQPPGPPSAAPPPFVAPDPKVIRDGTRRLLDEPAFRDAARGIAAEIAALPPADCCGRSAWSRPCSERQAAPAPRLGAPVRA